MRQVNKLFSWLVLAVFVCLATPALALTTKSGAENGRWPGAEDAITIDDAISDDAVITGGSVRIRAPISGETVVIGSSIETDQKPARSLVVAGATVRVNEGVGYNLVAAGSDVTIRGDIEHDAYVAGSLVTIKDAHIKGTLRVAADELRLGGQIDGDVIVTARAATSDAAIGGSLRGPIESLTFTGGSINGSLTYLASHDAIGLDKVKITGNVERSVQKSDTRQLFEKWLQSLLTNFVAAAAVLLLLSRSLREVETMVDKRWGRMAITGFLGLAIVPLASLLLAATLIGLPLAVILFGLYCLTLFVGVMMAQILLGRYIIRLTKRPVSWWPGLIVGVVATSSLALLPSVIGSVFRSGLLIGLVLPCFGALIGLWQMAIKKEQAG